MVNLNWMMKLKNKKKLEKYQGKNFDVKTEWGSSWKK